MSSITNQVQLIGNIGGEVQNKKFENGREVSWFSMATNESYKDKNGEKQTLTEWHNIVVWGGLSKVVFAHFKKGMKVLIQGKITNRSFEKQDGTTGYKTEIVMKEFSFMGGASNDASSPAYSVPPVTNTTGSSTADTADDIPSGDDDLPF